MLGQECRKGHPKQKVLWEGCREAYSEGYDNIEIVVVYLNSVSEVDKTDLVVQEDDGGSFGNGGRGQEGSSCTSNQFWRLRRLIWLWRRMMEDIFILEEDDVRGTITITMTIFIFHCRLGLDICDFLNMSCACSGGWPLEPVQT